MNKILHSRILYCILFCLPHLSWGQVNSEVPSAPGPNQLIQKQQKSLNIAWGSAMDDQGINSYQVFLDGLFYESTNDTTITFTGLEPSRTYQVKVNAIDTQGYQSDFNDISFFSTEELIDTIPPGIPEGLNIEVLTASSVTFAWDEAQDDRAVKKYEIFLDNKSVGATALLHFTLVDLKDEKNYELQVRSEDVNGNKSDKSEILEFETPEKLNADEPDAPTNLYSSVRTSSFAVLLWTASTSEDVVSYRVYRDDMLYCESLGAYAIADGLNATQSYEFKVTAIDSSGNESDPSNLLILTTGADLYPPRAPMNLISEVQTVNTIDLSWDQSEDDTGVTGYKVFQNDEHVSEVEHTYQVISGLVPNTPYFFYVTALDAAGHESPKSEIVSFQTLPDGLAPVPASNLRASNIGVISFDLEWEAAVDNHAIAYYEIFLNGEKQKDAYNTNSTLTDLTPLSEYETYIVAIDPAGNRSESSDTILVTTQEDLIAPTTPNGLEVTEETLTSISIKWSPSTDDSKALFYEILLDDEVVGSTTDSAFQLLDLVVFTTYKISIRAADYSDNKSEKIHTTAKTLEDLEAPSIPAGLISSNQDFTSIELSWTPSLDNVATKYYNIFADGSLIKEVTDTVTIVDGLASGASFEFTISAGDASGNESEKSDALIVSTLKDVDPPTTPQDLTSDFQTTSTINLIWEASDDNVIVDHYSVLLDGSLAKEVNEATALIDDLERDTAYELSLFAVDPSGNSSDTVSIEVRTLVDGLPPTIPTNLVADQRTDQGFVLNWTASTDDFALAGYQVFVDDLLVMTVEENTAELDGLSPSTAYEVFVMAFDLSNNISDPSTTITVTTKNDETPPSPLLDLAAKDITVKSFSAEWSPSTDNSGSVSYEVSLDGRVSGTTSDLSAAFDNLIPNRTYEVGVKAMDPSGFSSEEATIEVKTERDNSDPSIPLNLSSSNESYQTIMLTWEASTDDSGIDHYVIYQDDEELAESTDLSYTVRNLDLNTTYEFYVRAVDLGENESEKSNVISAKTLADETAPVLGSNFSTTASTINSIGLAWSEATDDVGVDGYQISRDGTVVIELSQNKRSITDEELTINTTYFYELRAIDLAGNLSAPKTLTASTSECDPPSMSASAFCEGEDGAGFFVNVTVTLGSSTDYIISNSSNNTTVEVSSDGTYKVGPFDNGSKVTVSINDADFRSCEVNSQSLTSNCSSGSNCDDITSLSLVKKLDIKSEVGDNEGSAYVPSDDWIWIADDNGNQLVAFDRATGEKVDEISQSEFREAIEFNGTDTPSSGRTEDIEGTTYDASNDIIYAFSGKCCPNPAAAFRLTRGSNGEFEVESWRALEAPHNDFTGAAAHPITGVVYGGAGDELKSFDYETYDVSTVENIDGQIYGMGFTPDGKYLWIAIDKSSIVRYRWSDFKKLETFDLKSSFGMRDVRAVEQVGDELYVSDGNGDLAINVFKINCSGSRPANRSIQKDEAFESKSDLQLYPNPTEGRVNVQYTLPVGSYVNVTLLDSKGGIVDQIISEPRGQGVHWFSYDLSPYPAGVYLMQVESEGTALTRRVVKSQ